MNEPDARVRFRIWVDAQLVDETWLDASNPEVDEHEAALAARHLAIKDEADRQDRPWLIELWDPEKDSYQRFGTDTAGIVDPQPMPPDRTDMPLVTVR